MGFEVHDNALSALCLPSIFHSIAWFYFPSYKFLLIFIATAYLHSTPKGHILLGSAVSK